MILVDLLDEIRTDLAALPEVRRVYADIPDAINEPPAVIVAAVGARCWMGAHGNGASSPMMCQHDIRVEAHVPLKDLGKASTQMSTIAPAIALALYSGFVRDRYNGTMVMTGDPRGTNAQGALDYTIGPSEWAGQQTYAMFCNFRITTEEETTS